jgi:hypothetical protein
MIIVELRQIIFLSLLELINLQLYGVSIFINLLYIYIYYIL